MIETKGTMKRIQCVLKKPVLVAFCAIFFLSPCVFGLEGGGSHYFGGNEDFGAGDWPSAGLSFNFTMLNYNFDRMKDSDGHTVSAPGGFQVDGVSNSLKIMYTTRINVLGGTLGWFLTPALVYQHVRSGERTQSKTEMGDLNFGVVLKRDFKTFRHIIGTDFFAPTGPYDKDDVCNIGKNYWTLGATYSFTYLGDRDSAIPGLEVSGRFAYYFHTTNTATHYGSGQEFSVDYLVGQRFGKNGWFRVGANGHYAYQVTSDRCRDEPPGFDGHKTRQFTIGPAVQLAIGKALLSLKAHWGVYDVNHGEGKNLWIKLWWPW